MNMAFPTSTARTFRTIRAHFFTAAGLAVAVAVAAVIGVTQLSAGGTSAPRHTATVAMPAAAAQPAAPVWYLVSSEDQKDALLTAIAPELDPTAFANISVIVAPNDEAANQVWQEVYDQNDILFSNGFPEITLVDLRASAQ